MVDEGKGGMICLLLSQRRRMGVNVTNEVKS